MSELSEKEELKKQKILVDIYKNENDHLKHEYRVLYDKFILTKNEYDKVNSNYSLLNEKYLIFILLFNKLKYSKHTLNGFTLFAW